jgi:hypothetical protein
MKTKFLLFFALIFSMASCIDEPALPDNLLNFEAEQLGFNSDENELEIKLNFSRASERSGSVSISFESGNLVYGTDYFTEPAAIANTINLDFDNAATQLTFKVIKTDNALFDGDESITFNISTAADHLVIGTRTTLTLTFAEILAEQAIMDINGGGSNYPNKVFIDLSANRQTSVERTSWDLGFHSGADFRVILNSSVTMMARAIDKYDLNTVTASDTIGFANEMIVGANALPEGMEWIDDPTGNLSKTAIAAISATASENKVYIINRGASNPPSNPADPIPTRGWKKIRIIRNTNGYTLQHADISATTFQEIQISKNETYLFNYISFEAGAVNVEPPKERWDIAWTGFTNSAFLGSGVIPYYFQDIVLQNRAGVQAVQLLTSNVGAYEDFTAANLAGLTFSSSQITIGSNWRSGGGPGSAPAVRSDRFYVVKDADGNIYKLRFTALTQNGERGRPQIEFTLLQ